VGQVDAVTVAAPTSVHAGIARPFLEGRRVLVEKPADVVARRRRRAGGRGGAPKRCWPSGTQASNPAIRAITPRVTSPRFVEAWLSGFPERSLDIDVVFDVMIGLGSSSRWCSEVVAVRAVGVPVMTDRFDIANARQVRVRMRSQRDGEPHRRTSSAKSASSSPTPTSRSTTPAGVEAYHLVRGAAPAADREAPIPREPLKIELEDFIAAVLARRPS
jgi:hypothetical protein